MTAPYTPRQGQYLAFIVAYARFHGQPPSEAEIATHLMVSPPSAHQMLAQY
jgi:Mn-dependent DtxR family transcriptional regulator